jgi:hypothetical protein
MTGRLERVAYPAAHLEVWGRIEGRLRQVNTGPTVTHRLWLIGVLVLGWRALQLLIDLPFPLLHPVVPLAGAVAALWLIACDPLAVETFAPELEKGGV